MSDELEVKPPNEDDTADDVEAHVKPPNIAAEDGDEDDVEAHYKPPNEADDFKSL